MLNLKKLVTISQLGQGTIGVIVFFCNIEVTNETLDNMVTFTPKNNFNHFKSDFKKDTGLDADKNMALYIQYYNARFTDWLYQLVFEQTNQMIQLPDRINRPR